jgi:GMP synthase (glutamine-hydrolysing)
MADHFDTVLVVDFGAQYAQLIARRVREARVFSEVIPHTASVEEIKARDPVALVLSGGPASVYTEGAPQLDPAVFDLGLPVFGICYGFQAMAQALGGTVAHTGTSEYGRTELKVIGGELHSGLPSVQPVWMSHGDAVTVAPDGFDVVASSPGAAASQNLRTSAHEPRRRCTYQIPTAVPPAMPPQIPSPPFQIANAPHQWGGIWLGVVMRK